MRKLTAVLLLFIGFVLVGGLLYRLPPVYDRLSWRIDFAMAYLRGVIDPVDSIPTALPHAQVIVTSQPTNTPMPTSLPTATPTEVFTPTPVPSPTPVPQAISLPSPEYEKQDINNCGPASLTMYLRYYGWEGVQDDIAGVLKPNVKDRNVNVEELAYFVRTRAGWLNIEYRVGGDLEMLKQFLAAGIPVLIEESFELDQTYWRDDDQWAAHYFLVTGYDETTQTFTGQDSFHGPDQVVDYEKLDEFWQSFNRLFILLYLPNQADLVASILGQQIDVDYNRQYALDIAIAETESDPQNAYAWFNLGSNLAYFERYIEATDAYDKARELGLPQRMLRYQFGPFIAYFHSGQIDELVALTEYALKITPNSEEALLWHGWAMYRQGNVNKALEDFGRALEENPNYLDAQYALDFVRSNQ
jgi:tetratricopeptide (TPR) repeat protein